MELDEKFRRRVREEAVADVLRRIAMAADRRDRPVPGDTQGPFSDEFRFDGGAARIQTGHIEYRFNDGTLAAVAAPVPALSVTIEFSNGCRVRIQQESWGPEDEHGVGGRPPS